MGQLGWHVDLGRCTGCHSCAISCKTENNTPLGTDWRQVITQEGGTYPNPKRIFVTMACFHCEKPSCLKACPVDAITKRASDGIVTIDQDKCVGCKRCAWACPYGAPRLNEETEKVEKCTFCIHRIDAGLKPACVTTCVGDALNFGEISDLSNIPGAEKEIDGLADVSLTNPNAWFTK